jgi:very-short-patch-repair endonuclease
MRRTTAIIDSELLELAWRQDAVVAARQLIDLGVRGHGLSARRDRGILHQVMPRIYSVGVAPEDLSRRGWEMVAQLRPRSGPVVLSHTSAASRLGLWDREPKDAPVHVLSEGRACTLTPPASPYAIVTHRSRSLPSSDAFRDGESSVSTACRTCLDLGQTHRPLQIASIIREGIHRRVLDVEELRSRLAQRRAAPGSAAVAAALAWFDRGSAGTRSRSEDELDLLIERAGLPAPLVNVRNATGMPGVEADFVWVHPKLIVELDGGHHDLPGARSFDAMRDESLRAVGWTVLRFHYLDVWQRPWDVIAAIHRALGHCSVTPGARMLPECVGGIRTG